MAQSEKGWIIERTCFKCGQKDTINVLKREAAFELVDTSNVPRNACKQCSSTSFATSYQRPDLDYFLLKEWATNPDLHLMPQDEELLLADEKYVDMILQVLDTVHIPDPKRDVLMDALCTIVYDNSIDDNPQRDDQLKNRVIEELNNRQDKLDLVDEWIPDYIKEIVYPQLNLGRQNAV